MGDRLDALLAGNRRFRDGASAHCEDRVHRRERFLDVHAPTIAVLSCADARVDPEVVFDAGLGDVFAVRIAGNLATAEAIASLDYAVGQLGVDTVIVLGHEGCGAVDAALDPSPGTPRTLLEPILAPIRAACAQATDRVDAVHRNTCQQARLVRRALPGVRVAAAVYQPGTGAVAIHDPDLEPTDTPST